MANKVINLNLQVHLQVDDEEVGSNEIGAELVSAMRYVADHVKALQGHKVPFAYTTIKEVVVVKPGF